MKLTIAGLILALALSAYGQNSITIGHFKYLGTVQGLSTYLATFDTTNVTLEPITIQAATMIVGPSAVQGGPFQTPQVWEEYGGYSPLPLWPCGNCAMIALQVYLADSGHPVTLTLANGDPFKTAGLVTVVIHAKPGQQMLVENQSVPIVLQRINPKTEATQ
jgi:hypothetical protein